MTTNTGGPSPPPAPCYTTSRHSTELSVDQWRFSEHPGVGTPTPVEGLQLQLTHDLREERQGRGPLMLATRGCLRWDRPQRSQKRCRRRRWRARRVANQQSPTREPGHRRTPAEALVHRGSPLWRLGLDGSQLQPTGAGRWPIERQVFGPAASSPSTHAGGERATARPTLQPFVGAPHEPASHPRSAPEPRSRRRSRESAAGCGRRSTCRSRSHKTR